MGRQRNRPQKKEQKNTPEEELNKMEGNNLSDIEFRLVTIYKDTQLQKHRHRNHKKGQIRNKDCNI